MAEIVNLNRVRKTRARAADAAQAAENRVRFGRGKADRARLAAEAEARERSLEGHRRVPLSDPPEPEAS